MYYIAQQVSTTEFILTFLLNMEVPYSKLKSNWYIIYNKLTNSLSLTLPKLLRRILPDQVVCHHLGLLSVEAIHTEAEIAQMKKD